MPARPTTLLVVVATMALGSAGTVFAQVRREVETRMGQWRALVPPPPGRFAPALTAVVDRAPSGHSLARSDSCGTCHGALFGQWRTSSHAMSSFDNPIYRLSVDQFRRQAGPRASNVCAGCHDPTLLLDGAMQSDEIAAADDRAHAGVGCRICHGVVAASAAGNGSFVLASEPLPIPASSDPVAVRRHRQAVGVGQRARQLCLSCHRGFLGAATGNQHPLPGMDEVGPWRESVYAGADPGNLSSVLAPAQPADCIECHMPMVPAEAIDAAADSRGYVRSHRMLGGHTWLAAMAGDGPGLRRAQAFIRDAASVDIVVSHGQVSPVLAEGVVTADRGETVVLEVVLTNRRVGHAFPGGVRDAQDTWLEVLLRNQNGRIVAANGLHHRQRKAATSFDDELVHSLRAIAVGADGRPRLGREVAEFRAVVGDTTLAPGVPAVVEYGLSIPPDLPEQLLLVEATLLHRSRAPDVVGAVCRAANTRRSRQFSAARRRRQGTRLTPCSEPPVTAIGRAAIAVRVGAMSAAAGAALTRYTRSSPVRQTPPRWQRLYEHAKARLRGPYEFSDYARPSLRAALAALPASAEAERAVVLATLAELEGRLGRTELALAHFAAAERLLAHRAGHPALLRARAQVLSRVWRFSEAADDLRMAGKNAPMSASTWRLLAVAEASAGRHEKALEAAWRALALAPRDPDSLRVQALSLRAVGAGEDQIAAAELALEQHRLPDAIDWLAQQCQEVSRACALERQPIHRHWLSWRKSR